MKAWRCILAIFSLFTVASCSSSPRALPSETEGFDSTATSEHPPLQNATQTALILSTERAITAPPQPSPTRWTELSDEGPWLVFMGSNGLMAMNQDASGITTLIQEDQAPRILLGPGSPSSQDCLVRIGDSSNFFSDLTLYLMNLATGELREITALLPEELSHESLDWETEEIHAVVLSAPAWSPSGDQVAFVGAIDGPSSDLYVYDLERDEITRLSSGPNEALDPFWTPDGSAIIHFEAVNLISMSDESPRRTLAIWLAEADGSGITKLMDFDDERVGGPISDIRVLGWSPDDRLLLSGAVPAPVSGGLRVRYFSLDSYGGVSPLAESPSAQGVRDTDPMRQFILQPRAGTSIRSPDRQWQAVVGNDGLSLVNDDAAQSLAVSTNPIDVLIWVPDSSGLFVSSDNVLYRVDLRDGQLFEVDSPVSAYSIHYTWVNYESNGE